MNYRNESKSCIRLVSLGDFKRLTDGRDEAISFKNTVLKNSFSGNFNGSFEESYAKLEAARIKGKITGKPQNKSEKSENDACAEMISEILGKPQNKSGIFGNQRHPKSVSVMDYIYVEGAIDALHAAAGLKRCLDKTIVAVLHTPEGVFFGTNGVKHQPLICSRNQVGDKVNQGYAKCQEVCRQPDHAELAAIRQWQRLSVGKYPRNAVINVYGTDKVCDTCQGAIDVLGIRLGTVTPDLTQLAKEL